LSREKQAEEKEEDSIPTGRYELELSHVSYAYTESPDVIEGKQAFAPSNPMHGVTFFIDTMGPDLVHFDDSLECPVRVEGETWYTCNREPSCCCQHWYDPAEDRQRYCQQCSKWWKLGCIRPSDANEVDYEVAESEDDESDEDDDEMLSLDDPEQVQTILAEFSPSKWYPIVRGFHGRYDKRNSWLISGSGNQVKMLREWAVARKPPADWANILGRGFLKDFSTNKTWLSYRCPGCRAKI
jgi:hypothetical protein